MTRDLHFCPQCGTATLAGQKKMAADFADEGAPMRRASYALGVLFTGGVFSLILGAALEDDWGLTHIFMTGIGVMALWILGWPSREKILGGSFGAAALGLGLLSGAVCFGINMAYANSINALLDGELESWPSRWWTVVLLAPLVEEWLMRGVAWEAMLRIGNTRATILATSALFALLHGLNGGAVLEFPHRFIGGLLLGWLRLRTGSIVPPILAHLVVNACAHFLFTDGA
ncbi:MAG: CPBP family intramembrane glutamic endopeptidase [Planctomycetota bacterium]